MLWHLLLLLLLRLLRLLLLVFTLFQKLNVIIAGTLALTLRAFHFDAKRVLVCASAWHCEASCVEPSRTHSHLCYLLCVTVRMRDAHKMPSENKSLSPCQNLPNRPNSRHIAGVCKSVYYIPMRNGTCIQFICVPTLLMFAAWFLFVLQHQFSTLRPFFSPSLGIWLPLSASLPPGHSRASLPSTERSMEALSLYLNVLPPTTWQWQ